MPDKSLASPKCPKCGSGKIRLTGSAVPFEDGVQVGVRCPDCDFKAIPQSIADFAKFFPQRSTDKENRENSNHIVQSPEKVSSAAYVQPVEPGREPHTTGYLRELDPSIKGNPSCQVCGAIMVPAEPWGMSEALMVLPKSWRCGSCGATSKPMEP